MRKFLFFVFVLLWPLAAHGQTVEENVGAYFSFADDGRCERVTRLLEADYHRTGGHFEGFASVKVSPFGGDCRTDALTYHLALERSFDWAAGFEVLFKFTAAEFAQSSLYGLAEGGAVIPRPDGAPLFATYLPSGTAQVVGGTVGISRDVPWGEIDLGINVVPVAWADHPASQTVHTAWGHQVGDFTAGVSLDVGRDSYGQAHLIWSRGAATCKLEYAWGLNAVSDGAPASQVLRGAEWIALGAPQDTRASFGCGLRWGL